MAKNNDRLFEEIIKAKAEEMIREGRFDPSSTLREVRVLNQNPPKLRGIFGRMATSLFGWDRRSGAGKRPPWQKYADDVVSSLNAQRLAPSWLSLPSDRIALYDLYDELDNFDLISSILEAYADNATQISPEQDRAVWVDSGEQKLKDEIYALFDEIDLEGLIEGMAYDLAKNGDDFARLAYAEKEGVYHLNWLDPRTVERVEDESGTLIGFLPVEIASSIQLLSDLDEEKIWQPHDMVHWRTMRTKYRRNAEQSANEHYSGSNAMYGTSSLRNVRRVGKQLRFLEELLIIFRLTRAVDKHIYSVDVGTDNDQVSMEAQLKYWERKLKGKDFRNPDTGEFDALYNAQGLNEDIIFPIRGGESNSKIDVRQGLGNIADIVDVDYFLSKLYSSLGVPKEFAGFEGGGNYDPTKSLSAQSVRFNRAVVRLQKALLNGIYWLVDIHLFIKGWKPEQYQGKYKLAMMAPSDIEVLSRLDAFQLRMSNSKDSMEFNDSLQADPVQWRLWVMKDILGLRDSQIEEFFGPKPEETIAKNIEPVAPEGDVGDDGLGDDEAPLPVQDAIRKGVLRSALREAGFKEKPSHTTIPTPVHKDIMRKTSPEVLAKHLTRVRESMARKAKSGV